jgi:adenine deaminase
VKKTARIAGQIVDLVSEEIFPGEIAIRDGRIASIERLESAPRHYIMPGLIDAHVHVESSMLVPSEFARLAVAHGTVAAVSDPHEMANVLGLAGVEFMLKNAARVPFKFCFGAPACVPPTPFESSGAAWGPADLYKLLARKDIGYLSEVMDFSGNHDHHQEVSAKLALARKLGKPIDGHAPGILGDALKQEIQAGISTDHECTTLEEGAEKVRLGMKVILREGSAAKNLEALLPLLDDSPGMVMLCSDDKHPDDLVRGHIDQMVRRALKRGIAPIKVLKAACLNPVKHYRLSVGLLQAGDPADFIVVDNFEEFRILKTYIDGEKVAERGVSLIAPVPAESLNRFGAQPLDAQALRIPAASGQLRVIEVENGQLLTKERLLPPCLVDGGAVSDPSRDLLKLVVLSRYQKAAPALCFVKNFSLKRGAIASSVAHDSHNIIATGASDEQIVRAINLVIRHQGGIAVVDGEFEECLRLPVGGLMTTADGYQVAAQYEELNRRTRALGCELASPFMTLSFLTLLVIPDLKVSDKGLFDTRRFEFVPLFV